MELTEVEASVLLMIIREKLFSLEVRAEHWNLLNHFDKDKFPDYMTNSVEHEVNILRDIMEKIDVRH